MIQSIRGYLDNIISGNFIGSSDYQKYLIIKGTGKQYIDHIFIGQLAYKVDALNYIVDNISVDQEHNIIFSRKVHTNMKSIEIVGINFSYHEDIDIWFDFFKWT